MMANDIAELASITAGIIQKMGSLYGDPADWRHDFTAAVKIMERYHAEAQEFASKIGDPGRGSFESGVTCWTCPDCGFSFDARMTNVTPGLPAYTCPCCDMVLAEARRDEENAEIEAMDDEAQAEQDDLDIQEERGP